MTKYECIGSQHTEKKITTQMSIFTIYNHMKSVMHFILLIMNQNFLKTTRFITALELLLFLVFLIQFSIFWVGGEWEVGKFPQNGWTDRLCLHYSAQRTEPNTIMLLEVLIAYSGANQLINRKEDVRTPYITGHRIH